MGGIGKDPGEEAVAGGGGGGTVGAWGGNRLGGRGGKSSGGMAYWGGREGMRRAGDQNVQQHAMP